MLALTAFMVEREGGFALTVWAPVALALLGLAVTTLLSAGRFAAGVPWPTLAAGACFTAFTLFAFASIGWADVRGDAWDGANKALLYLIAFVLLAAWPITVDALWPVVLAFAAVVTAEGVWTVERIVHSADPTQFTIGTRLSEPLGYPNATAALYMILLWLLIGLASRPWLAAPFRALAFGLAGLDAALNLLTESRGSVFTLPLVVIVYFAIVPGRIRSALVAALVALASTPVAFAVVDVYHADPYRMQPTLAHALHRALLLAVLLAIAGGVFALVDDHWRPSARVTRAAGATLAAGLVLALVGVGVATTPWNRLDSAWHSFKYAGEPSGAASRFGGLGSNRYDFWRVGLIEFTRHPLAGIGMDNFSVPYLQQRRSDEAPQNPHSLPVRLLSQTGVIGTLLFVAFLVLALLSVARIPRGRERELAGILVVGFSVWLLHGAVDWLWEMPVLGLLAVSLLALACALAPRRAAATPARPALRALPAVVGSAAALAALVSIALPWLSAREVQAAVAGWRADPAGAFASLHRARRLDPLSENPDLIAGAIAGRLHRYPEMREHYAAAVARTPDDWYGNLELGIAASLTGMHDLAASSLARAERLNPRDPIVQSVVATFRAGKRIDSDAVDRAFATAKS